MTATATARRRTRPATKRRRTKRRRSWQRKALAVTAILVVLALVGGSIWVVYFSAAFVTKRVNVVGARHLTPMQLSSAVQVPLGVPLARQNLDEIARRVMSLPAVETATAARNWPNTITVTVVERRPVFAVPQPDGYLVVDKFGVAYQTQSARPPNVVLAEVSLTDVPLIREVATVAAALPATMRGKVAGITAASRDNIVLNLKAGPKVSWGDSGDSELKAQVMAALIKRKPKSSIDVSSPHNPAVR